MGFGSILKEIIKPVTNIVDKVIVDKDEKRRLDFELERLIDEADKRYHDEVMGQLEVNKTEAEHPSTFVAGWRPSIGWVGSLSLFVFYPVQMVIELWNTGTITMEIGELITLVGGMLGMGYLRSQDKLRGVDTKAVGNRD